MTVPGVGGGPKIEVDFKIVDNLCEIQCTAEEIAGVLGVSSDTLDRRIREEKKCGTAEYLRQKRQGGKESLRRKQWSKAVNDGDTTMLIWLGKNVLGQKDKQDFSSEDGTFKPQFIQLTGPNESGPNSDPAEAH